MLFERLQFQVMHISINQSVWRWFVLQLHCGGKEEKKLPAYAMLQLRQWCLCRRAGPSPCMADRVRCRATSRKHQSSLNCSYCISLVPILTFGSRSKKKTRLFKRMISNIFPFAQVDRARFCVERRVPSNDLLWFHCSFVLLLLLFVFFCARPLCDISVLCTQNANATGNKNQFVHRKMTNFRIRLSNKCALSTMQLQIICQPTLHK